LQAQRWRNYPTAGLRFRGALSPRLSADAEERPTKLRLVFAINGVVARRRLTEAAATEKLGTNQPKVSALANYKLDGFSVERLMTFLTALDQDVEIVSRKEPRSRAAGQISVVAA
jgi:predicted XRE-type DNA-binding protein